MKAVVDANILLSCLLRDGWTRRTFLTSELTFVAPSALREEVLRHAESIRGRSDLDASEFEALLEVLFSRIRWVADERIEPHLAAANKAVGDADPKDVAYAACALADEGDLIWSYDDDLDGVPRIPRVTNPQDLPD